MQPHPTITWTHLWSVFHQLFCDSICEAYETQNQVKLLRAAAEHCFLHEINDERSDLIRTALKALNSGSYFNVT